MTALRLARTAVLVGAAVAPALAGDAPTDARRDLLPLARALDAAVLQVSHPGPMPPAGAAACRAYRLPGYGAVFVLAPRLMPPRNARAAVKPPSPAPAAPAVPPPDARASLERSLADLRATARRNAKTRPPATDIAELRRQAALFEREAARAQEESERMLAMALAQLAGPLPQRNPQLTVDAPWREWIELVDDADERTPEGVMEAVRAAVISTLAQSGASLRGIAADESVTVTVDFVDMAQPFAGPQRTLVLRLRKADLDAAARNELTADALRARAEITEY
jgi:hypothetical protein